MVRARLCSALLCFALTAGSALAADPDDSSFELGLYMWATAMHGEIETNAGDFTNHTSFSDIWDNLSLGGMGHARYQTGRFSVVSDVVYADLETDREHKSFHLGPGAGIAVEGEVKFKAQMWVADLSGGMEIFHAKDALWAPRGEVYLGARYWSFSSDIDADIGTANLDASTTEAWVDPIVGARFALALSKTVELSVLGDVGGFGVGSGSEFQWMQTTALSWRFADHWRFHMAYKFLQFRRDDGDVNIREQLRGPALAVTYIF